MKKSAKPKQNRIALLTLLFTLMGLYDFRFYHADHGAGRVSSDPKRNLDHRGKRQI